jgi:Flp pilus assembly protein TadG
MGHRLRTRRWIDSQAVRDWLVGRQSEYGGSAVEFALVLPLLGVLVFGIITFGLAINNYEMLTGAVNEGARALALSRGAATPYASTVSLVDTAAPGLNSAHLNVTLSVNGQTCSSDSGGSACSALLTAGATETVAASYPCSLVVMGVNYAPGCTLSQQTSGRVE